MALRKNAAVGVFTADRVLAAHHFDSGANFLRVDVDTLLLRNASAQLAGRFEAKPGGSH